MTSFYVEFMREKSTKQNILSYLGRQLEHFLGTTEEVRAQSGMKLLDLLFIQLFVLFGKCFQIIPLFWVQEIHEIEQLADVVIQRCLCLS